MIMPKKSIACLIVGSLAAQQTYAFTLAFNHGQQAPTSNQLLMSTPSEDDFNDGLFAKALKQSTVMAPVVLTALSFAVMPNSAHAGDIAKGNEVFTANCVGCHRGGQNFVKEQKTLQRDALEKYVGMDEEKVTKFFKESFVHKVVGGKLTDDEVADVVSYVVDQASGQKW
jgi:cytochrome c6